MLSQHLSLPVATLGLLQGPKFQEIVNLRLADGELRRGQVLEIDGDKAVVQVSPLQLLLS